MTVNNHPVEGELCNAYCAPPCHALSLLAEPGSSREDVLANLGPYFIARGWHLVDASRAREADVVQWQKDLTYRVTGGSVLDATDRLAPATAEPWLLFVEGEA